MLSRWLPEGWQVDFIKIMRALSIGLTYYLAVRIPGLTSSFVAILCTTIAFDFFVAMKKFQLNKKIILKTTNLLLPLLQGTVLALARGLVIGFFFGILTHGGIPVFLSAVLTAGISYTWSDQTKGNNNAYVGLIAALAVFEAIINVDLEANQLAGQVKMVTLISSQGTFLALFEGWLVGSLLGVFTRLSLTRGYRTVDSLAYDLPLDRKPFREAMTLEEGMTLTHILVRRDSLLSQYASLEALKPRENFCTSILAIYRGKDSLLLPTGTEKILPGDRILVVGPTEQISELIRLSRTKNEKTKTKNDQ